MSHLRVKTTYSSQGAYESTETKTLYCHHNLSADTITFYDEKGDVMHMSFHEWIPGEDLWDAMTTLRFPFSDEWGGELKEGVEYYRSIDHDRYKSLDFKNVEDELPLLGLKVIAKTEKGVYFETVREEVPGGDLPYCWVTNKINPDFISEWAYKK